MRRITNLKEHSTIEMKATITKIQRRQERLKKIALFNLLAEILVKVTLDELSSINSDLTNLIFNL